MKRVKLRMGAFAVVILLAGCGNSSPAQTAQDAGQEPAESDLAEGMPQEAKEYIQADSEITKLESGFSVVRFEGDDGFDAFLNQGGAESDRGVLEFLAGTMLGSADGLSFAGEAFGCSTISVQNAEGGYYFGRNFDWNKCDAMVVLSYPESGYASVSTVNMDFIRQGAGVAARFLKDDMLTVAALYAPLDGMNEEGLCVSVNMIQDGDTIAQDEGRPDITTTTAIRMLLNQAASVDEAVELLAQYDFHASMDYMVHLAIADSSGKSAAVEYVNDEMHVIETPVLTNFYLTEGEKYGIGTDQSHTRFEILEDTLAKTPVMDSGQVRDALGSVSKGNFGEFESTEWSVVFDQAARTAEYYHREDYSKSYAFKLID